MSYRKSPLLLIALSLMLTGCASQTQLLKPPEPPLECIAPVSKLPLKSQLPNGLDWEKKVAREYVELANNYNCLVNWLGDMK